MFDIITKAPWPFVVLVLGITFFLVFRKRINELLGNLRSFSLGKDRQLIFGEAQVDNPDHFKDLDRPQKHLSSASGANIRWENSGNLFWLGHDLMWTMQMALRGAPFTEIVRGLAQSNYHAEHLNLANSRAGLMLARLLSDARNTSGADWTVNKRNNFATDIDSILSEFGFLAASNQPDFEQDVQPK